MFVAVSVGNRRRQRREPEAQGTSRAARRIRPRSPSDVLSERGATAVGYRSEFEQAQSELVGKAVVLSDGKAGTVARVWLDEMHGLRISINGQDGKWPVSTIKLAQS